MFGGGMAALSQHFDLACGNGIQHGLTDGTEGGDRDGKRY